MKKKVLIIGAGLSGRGMLGELFFRDGYDITFADNDPELVRNLKSQGFYHVTMTNLKSGVSESVKIEGFHVIDTVQEKRTYIETAAQSDLICTALKPDAFDDVIDHLAAEIGIRSRRKMDRKQNITLGANYVGLYEYFDRGIRKKLGIEELGYYEKYVSLVMSIINRKNLHPIKEKEMLDPCAVSGDDKPVLRVENTESIRMLKPMPAFFRPEENLSAAMAVKIWSGNVVQCSMAFVALYRGKRDTREASFDPVASRMAYHAALEAYYGVFREYDIEETDIPGRAQHAVTLFRSSEFEDDLIRIVREPIRKIGYNDRFIGPARLCLKYGKLPYFITRCLAYVFLLDIEGKQDCRLLRTGVQNEGVRKTVMKYCGLSEEKESERILIDLIENAYMDISEEGFE